MATIVALPGGRLRQPDEHPSRRRDRSENRITRPAAASGVRRHGDRRIALGIAATTAIDSVANAILFRPLPFRDADRVVHLFESDDPNARPDNRLVTRPGNYYDWKAQNQVFEQMGAYAIRTVALSSGADHEAQLLMAHRVIEGYFEALGVPPAAGRLFSRELWDAPVIAAAVAVMLVTTLLSTLAPARRAAAVDPAVALRAE